MAHAKAVLLVDDEQAQVVELGGFTEKLVCAHHDVHRAVANSFDGGGDLLAGAEARYLGNLHRPLAETVHQRLVVLFGQQRRGREEGHLLAARHSHEGRAQRHLGLAKAHIAADQAVHGAGADHVLDHRVDGGILVGRFFKAEVVGKGLVVLRAVAEGMAFARRTPGVDVEQLGCAVAHLLGSLAFGLFPLAAAQLVQRRLVGAHAGVAADELQLAHGHIQHGLVGIFQVQKLLHGGRAIGVLVAHVHVDQAPVAADAVLAVDHRVSHVQLGQVLDQRLDIAHLFLLLAAARGGACGKQLGLGDEVDAVLDPAEAHGQPGGGDAHLFVGCSLKLGQRIKRGRIQLRRAQKVQQTFASAVTLGQQQHAVLGVADVGVQAGQRVFRTAHDRQVAKLLEVRVVIHVLHAGAQRQLGMLVGAGVELVYREKQRFGRQGRALGVALHQTEAVFRVLPEALEGGLQVAVQNHRGFVAQVIKYGGRLVKKQRQVVLDARRGHARAHVFVDAALGRVALQHLAPAAAEFGARIVVHGELAAGQKAHLGHGVQAALAVGVEGADAVDFVVEQVYAEWHERAHGEQVDQPAAHRVFAGAYHLRYMAVPGQRELGLELGFVQLLLRLEVEGVAGQERGGCQAVQRSRGGYQHHIGLALRDAPQCGQPLADQVLVRAERVVGQRLPVREQRAAQAGRKEGHLVDEALRVGSVGGDDGRGAVRGFVTLGQAGQQQGIGAAHGAGQGEAFTRGEFWQFHAETVSSAPQHPLGREARTGWAGRGSGDFRMLSS